MNKEEPFYREKAHVKLFVEVTTDLLILFYTSQNLLEKMYDLENEIYQRTEVKVEVLFCKGRIH